MTATSNVREGTVICELLHSLVRAATYNAQVETAPAAILWTDKERQWEPLVPRLREALPQFITLGPYNPKERTGPAIWVKCMIARALPEADWPEEAVPILYVPGVSRQELRAVEECPQELQPLAELQYRGVWFSQENTKDWTVYAFLTSKRGGLGLDIAGDSATREAILQALSKLADTPVAELRGRRLHAVDFHALLQPDLVRQLLRWLNAPAAIRASLTAQEWQAFCAACRERYGFDPEKDGELVGAEKLGSRAGNWEAVWARFAEAPGAYLNIPELLRQAKPQDENNLFFQRDCWPQCNEEEENKLRDALAALAKLAPDVARAEIERLDTFHGARRAWVWARLGQAPLARALEHLVILARATRTALGGADATGMAATYVAHAWQADAAVLDALVEVTRPQDVAAVKAAIEAVYKPWLEAGAECFQQRISEASNRPLAKPPQDLSAVGPGTCIVFADALRLDLAKRLRTALEQKGFQVGESWRWVPWPPVTATAKPMASPVAGLVTGEGAHREEFQPVVRDTLQPLTPERFHRLLSDHGFQILTPNETGDPGGRGWTECGNIDRRGHEEGWKLAHRTKEETAALLDRIQTLLEAGWKEIRVTTDHGWLLVPGGLPRVEMPHYLVADRWTRCATLKPGSQVELPTVNWHWNPDVTVVLAPGIGTFRSNQEYAHGGLSLQECVVLDLVVRAGLPVGKPSIESIRWTGLRCRVRVAGTATGCSVDLRTKAGDPASSLVLDGKPQPLGKEGDATLLVEDPDHEGTAAVVVVLDSTGRVVAKQNTTVGGEA